MDVLDSMIRDGVSRPRPVEHTVQWDNIRAWSHLYTVILDYFHVVEGCVLLIFIVLLVVSIIGSVTSSLG